MVHQSRKRRTAAARWEAGFRILLLLLFLVPALPIRAGTGTPRPLPNTAWGRLLSRYLEEGRVDYREIARHPELLEQALDEFEEISRQEYGAWNREEKVAFWINAYNLFTIQAVVEDYPPKGHNLLYPRVSLRQIGGVWEKTLYRAAGRVVSLGEIQQRILPALSRDPRIPFALVPASLGAPPLPAVPYDGASLDRMLELRVRSLLSDSVHGLRWDPETRTLFLSPIFAWHTRDFRETGTASRGFPDLPARIRRILDFCWEYLGPEIRGELPGGPLRISFLPYDWGLNQAVR